MDDGKNIGGDLPSKKAGLPPDRRALMELRLKQRAKNMASKPAVTPNVQSRSGPLSFAQQRIWFLTQFQPDNPVYNVYRAWRLMGRLDIEALQQAVTAIVARHGVLRSTIKVVDGLPIQETASALNVRLSIVDLRRYSSTEREAKSIQFAITEARLPFDLEKGPMFRVKLLQLGDDDFVLLLNLHHIVSDGWSVGVLHHELGVLYEAFSGGKPSPLMDLPIQYSDYSRWQRERLQGDMLVEQLSYWKRQLADLTVLELPTDRLRPPVQNHRGAREGIRLSGKLLRQLKGLSQQEGATLFMTVLAAIKALLYRYTGQEDIVVGTPIANRKSEDLEPLIGMLVNTLVLRTDLSRNPSFKELLRRLRAVSFEAYAHQDLPFEKLVEELQPRRDMSRNPLFQVTFTWQNRYDPVLVLPGLNVSRFSVGSVGSFDTGNGTAKFDLTIGMVETGDGIEGMFEYNTDLFDATTIRRMADHLGILLERIAADPEQRLTQISASFFSMEVLGATNRSSSSGRAGSGIGSDFRSTLPLGVNGRCSSQTKNEGTI